MINMLEFTFEPMENKRVVELENRLVVYGINCVLLCEGLPRTRFGINMEDQLARSSISPCLNYGEAQAAESIKDFIHKMKICLKELRESRTSLKAIKLYYERKGQIVGEADNLIEESSELIAIFTSSINTARKNNL